MPTDEAASDGGLRHREPAEVRCELLTTRDELIGAQVALGEALGRIAELEAEVARHQAAVREIRGYRGTPVWTGFVAYLRLRRRLGSIRRRALASFHR